VQIFVIKSIRSHQNQVGGLLFHEVNFFKLYGHSEEKYFKANLPDVWQTSEVFTTDWPTPPHHLGFKEQRKPMWSLCGSSSR